MLNVCFLAVVDALVLLLELLQTAGFCQNSTALAGVKRVARRADSYADFLHCGAGHEGVSAGACNFAFLILRMNIFFHGVNFLLMSQAETLNQ